MCINVCVYSCRMPFHFCPQCGKKLQPDFKFCPCCGEKLPSPVDESDLVNLTPSLSLSPPKRDEAVAKSSLASCLIWEPTEGTGKYLDKSDLLSFIHMCVIMHKCKFSFSLIRACNTSTPVTPRPALQKTRISLRLDKEVKLNIKDATPPVVPSTRPVGDGRIKGN